MHDSPDDSRDSGGVDVVVDVPLVVLISDEEEGPKMNQFGPKKEKEHEIEDLEHEVDE